MDQDDRIAALLTSSPTLTLDGDTLTLTSGTESITFVDREVVETYVRAPGWVASLTGRGADWSHAKERVSTDLVWVVLGLLAVAGVALWG